MVNRSEEALKEKKERFHKIDQMMEHLNLDAILFTSTSQISYQMLVKYLTDMPLTTRRFFVFKEPGKEPELFMPMAGDKNKVFNRSWIETEHLNLGNMLNTVVSFIGKMSQEKPKIGWAMVSEIPHEIYMALQGTKAEFVDITREFTLLRSNKSEYERKLSILSSDLAVGSFEDLIRRMKVGMTEYELIGGAIGYLAERGAGDMLILGQSKKPFASIKSPVNVKLNPDDIFVYSAEFGGPGGYWTQLIRPVFMDRNSHRDAYDIWKIALEAEQAAAEVIRPGNQVQDIHFAIQKTIEKNGLRMNYWAGHGMGCDLGDGVDICPGNDMPIVPNMVLTLQPSIESDTNSLLYGNTFLSTESGEPINMTGKYMESPYYEDLYSQICG